MSSAPVAIVTGAASGIGLGTAGVFAQAGYRVVLLDRSAQVHAAADALGASEPAESHTIELTDFEALGSLVKGLDERLGRIDVLVNNAAISPKRNGRKMEMDDIDLAIWNEVLAVNLTAPFMLCKMVLPVMKRARHGRIINISSRSGRTYSPDVGGHYAASKAGLIGFTRILAGEVGVWGITANCIAPGRIMTPLASEGVGSALHEKCAAEVPARRVGTPEEIGAAALYLASDSAAYITGTVLDVNGGMFMT